jgi:hypothetical protein
LETATTELPRISSVPASIVFVARHLPNGLDDGDAPGEPLASARDGSEQDGSDLTRVLDAISGAWDCAELGRAQGAAGETTPLDQL